MDLGLIGNLLQTLGSLTLLYSYLPQIFQLIKTRRSEDMNIQFWGVLTLGLVCIAGNMFISNVPNFILFTQLLNAVFALITLILVIKYKEKK
ncbi:MAG: PQ-loop domain-containing transporter [Clostridium perfringens]|nr:PQ-loop domain-containing transporter [Clostridium perfringens]